MNTSVSKVATRTLASLGAKTASSASAIQPQRRLIHRMLPLSGGSGVVGKNWHTVVTVLPCAAAPLVSRRTFVTKSFRHQYGEREASIKLDENTFELRLGQSNSDTSAMSRQFPYVWLRDNCTCPRCFNSTINENTLDLLEMSTSDDASCRPNSVRTSETGNQIQVTWQDGHESTYDLLKLAEYALADHNKRLRTRRLLWNNSAISEEERAGRLVPIALKQFVNNPEALRSALLSIYKYGFVIIENVDNKREALLDVCRHIGHVQSSFYSKDVLVITSNLEFADRAFSNLPLRAHTDTTYLRNSAGLELFHVIQRPEEGGDSLLVDGFHCASELRRQSRADYDVLRSCQVEYENALDGSYAYKYSANVIVTDPRLDPAVATGDEDYDEDESLVQIRLNPYHKAHVAHMRTSDEISAYYKAMRHLTKIVRDPRNELWIPLRTDQVMLFDNYRLLHGRSAIGGRKPRTLSSAYLNRDDYLSKLAVHGIV